jgi:outer membrane receptor protein involved in Fe transport
VTQVQRYGVGALPNGSVASRYQTQKDVEIAAFGEGTYAVTDRLKVIAGGRISRVQVSYFQAFEGTLNKFLIPTTENGGLTSGGTQESPVTPRLGVQWQITNDKMVYLNAARGYRPGGVNAPLPVAVCTGLATQGLTTLDIPTTYGSDSVWSYEGGAKLRLLGNRLQLNGSLYRIDWSDVQVAISTAGCGPTYTMNAGTARSQGFDLDMQARVLPGLTIDGALGYTDAKYTEDALGPTPRVAGIAASKAVSKGDTLPVPPWTLSVGFRYEFQVSSKWGAYIRGDYRYQSKYFRSPGFGVNAYAPDTRNADASDIVNARVGATMGGLDVNLYVNNLFDSKDLLGKGGGRTGCTASTGPACTGFSTYNPLLTGSTFRPRTIGLQAAYRY